MSQSTPLRGSTSSSAYFWPGIGSDTICHIPAPVHHIPGLFHHRSTILSVLGLPFPHGFVFGNSRENFPVDHPSWECSGLLLA
ncbi:hypothetical protein ACFX2G_024429 [Malus domestica]